MLQVYFLESVQKIFIITHLKKSNHNIFLNNPSIVIELQCSEIFGGKGWLFRGDEEANNNIDFFAIYLLNKPTTSLNKLQLYLCMLITTEE